MQAIAIQSMNISQVIQSPRQQAAQINNLYSHSTRDIALAMAGNKECPSSATKSNKEPHLMEDGQSTKNE
jgi:hypothetical protein